MAISWGLPKLVSKILEAVPAINYLLNALAKMDYTGTEDVPIGAVRLESLSGGYQLQRYNGTSWVSVGKLIHDAETVDGKSASTTATADTIPVRDSSGKVPGDITGNAATASSAAALSTTLPVSGGGTGATNPEGARSNLGVPPTSHASTGTTYGLSSASQYGHAMAASDDPAQDTDAGSVGSDVTHFARGDHAHKKVLGTSSVYGQVKLTDSVSDGSDASLSVAASAKAVKDAYDKASSASNAAVPMTGATATSAGKAGFVPQPAAGEQNKPLTGGGNYADSLDCDISGHAAKDLPLTGGTVTGNVTVTQDMRIDGKGITANVSFENAPACDEICKIDAYNNFIRLFGAKTQKVAMINIKTGEFVGNLSGYASNSKGADAASLAYTTPNVFMQRGSYTSGGVWIPAGGTWRCCAISENQPTNVGYTTYDVPGGSNFNPNYGGYGYMAIAIRIA